MSFSTDLKTRRPPNQNLLLDEIRRLAGNFHMNVVEFRRHLHAYPELSFEEFQTSAFVKTQLDEIGISWQSIAGTGVLALIKGEKPSDAVIALRADMDALPVAEENNVPYASKNTGVMHACGHDVHTSSLLGTAAILQSIKAEFGGTVKLIFQLAEEKLPGGASLMISEGVLLNPVPSAVIGQHVMPFLESGKIGVRKGKHMASMDELYITVIGKGGHGAQPHLNIDPVIITSHIILALQQVVSRMADPFIPTVLTFGKLVANGSINVVADEVYMEGTFRTMDDNWRNEAHKKMKHMAEGIAESMGGKCHFNIIRGYPFLVNEEKLTEKVIRYAEEYMGKENVINADLWMASEDFAYYSQVVSSCFYLLGTGNKVKSDSSLHTSTFDIDEDSLRVSTGLMAYIAVKELGN